MTASLYEGQVDSEPLLPRCWNAHHRVVLPVCPRIVSCFRYAFVGVEPPVCAKLRRRPMRHTFLPLSAPEAGGVNQGTQSFAGRAKRW